MFSKKLFPLFVVSTLLSGGLILLDNVPGAYASAPSSSVGNTAYINGTLDGSTTNPNLAQQILTIDGVANTETLLVSNSASSPTWSGSSTSSSYTFSLGSFSFISGNTVQVNSFVFTAPTDISSGEADVNVVSAVLSYNGNQYSYSFTNTQGESLDSYFVVNPSWTVSATASSVSASLQITVTALSSTSFASQGAGGSTIGSTATGFISSYPASSSVAFTGDYFYSTGPSSGTPSNTYAPSLPSGFTQYSAVWSSSYSVYLEQGNPSSSAISLQGPSTSDTYTTGTAYTFYFRANAAPSDLASFTVTIQIENIVKSVSQAYNSGAITQTITQSINWWNASTVSNTIPLPSGWNTGASFSGSITHILAVGYGTGALIDRLNVGGYTSKTFSPVTSLYNSIAISGTVGSAGLIVNVNTSEYITYTITTTATPPDFSSIDQSSTTFTLTYLSPIKLSEIQAFVGGTLEDRFTNVSYSGSASFSYLDPSLSPLYVQWQLTTGEYTQWVNLSYGGSTGVPENSSSVIVMQSSSVTHSYPITLSGVPSGSGYYQQLVAITNPSQYGINSAGSNIQFAAPNGTLLYAWEQSVNSSSIQVWIKNSNGSSTINMQVFPSFENLFSASGYLGEAPQLSSTYNASNNAYEVFGDGYFFTGTSSTIPFGTIGSPQYYQDNGLFINDTGQYNGLYIPTQFNNANYGLLFNAYYKDSGNTANQGATLGWANGGTNYNGLEEFSNTIYLNSYDGTTNHLSGAIPMSVTSYNNFRFYLTANQTYTTSNVNYSGSHYSQGLGELQQYGSSSFSDIELMTSLNSLYVHYVIPYRLIPTMPTFSISGSGSAFMANATTTNSFPGMPGKMYNSTWQYVTYNIDVGPTTNYTTVIYNESWVVAGIFPSTYKVFASQGLLLLSDVKGYVQVAVTFIQPSSQIGSASTLFFTYNYPSQISSAGIQQYTNRVSYTPFGQSAPQTITTSSSSMTVPWGSIVSASVLNQWNQTIGTISPFVVDQTSVGVSVNLNVTQINFNVQNGTGSVWIEANGANYSFFNSVIVANGSLYRWTMPYYSLTSGQEYRSGTVQASGAEMTLPIYLNAPPGILQVNVNAYSGSNLGSIGSGGNPRVNAYINGQPYTLGSTYTGFVGSTYEIRIADLLNQTLLVDNYTLTTTEASVTMSITQPSYWMGLENDEIIPQNSNLATEYVSINLTGSPQHFNFTDSVGQNWVGYFKAGNYTVYMHDNVTGTFYINITSANSQRYLFGQGLLTLAQFQAEENRLLNATQAVQNTTYGLHVQSFSLTYQAIKGQTVVSQFSVFYHNYTSVTKAFLDNSIISVAVTNQTGAVQTIAFTTSTSSNDITITMADVPSGNLSVRLIVENGKYAGAGFYGFSSAVPASTSVGLSLSFGVTQNIYSNQTLDVPLYLYYSNGSRLNLSDTALISTYATLYILQGNTIIHTYAPVNYTTGTLDFGVAALPEGSYIFYAVVTPVNLSGSQVHASVTQSESAAPQSLTPLQSFYLGLQELASVIVNNLVTSIIIALIMAVGAYGIRKFYTVVMRHFKRDKKDTNTVDMNLIASLSIPMTKGTIDSALDLATRYASLSASEQDAFLRAPDGVLKNYSVQFGKKEINLMEAREKIEKLQKKENSHQLFGWLRTRKGSEEE